jgi:tRNA-2-methylthio-N6-dimethylallyladenosine synthase
MVEGKNPSRGQITGRTSQNKTLNFVVNNKPAPGIGEYVRVQVTQTFPNSLLGEITV